MHLIKYINKIHMKSIQIMISGMKGNMGNQTVIHVGQCGRNSSKGGHRGF